MNYYFNELVIIMIVMTSNVLHLIKNQSDIMDYNSKAHLVYYIIIIDSIL